MNTGEAFGAVLEARYNHAKALDDALDGNLQIIEDTRRVPEYQINHLTVGCKAYHVNGHIPAKIIEVEGNSVTIEVKGTQRYHHAEEWQHTPWTDEEKAAYFQWRIDHQLK